MNRAVRDESGETYKVYGRKSRRTDSDTDDGVGRCLRIERENLDVYTGFTLTSPHFFCLKRSFCSLFMVLNIFLYTNVSLTKTNV